MGTGKECYARVTRGMQVEPADLSNNAGGQTGGKARPDRSEI